MIYLQAFSQRLHSRKQLNLLVRIASLHQLRGRARSGEALVHFLPILFVEGRNVLFAHGVGFGEGPGEEIVPDRLCGAQRGRIRSDMLVHSLVVVQLVLFTLDENLPRTSFGTGQHCPRIQSWCCTHWREA